MSEFLDTYNLAKLNQYDIHNLRKPMKPSELKAVITNLHTLPPKKKKFAQRDRRMNLVIITARLSEN